MTFSKDDVRVYPGRSGFRQYPNDDVARATYKARRKERLKAAKALGRHTQAQWEALVAFCGGLCVQCGRPEAGNLFICKDHILPVARGGSDAIDNLQPMCTSCNPGKRDKRDEDLRPAGWREAQP
jgi:5-methylcytosine-specific restriction endonuclease McrA